MKNVSRPAVLLCALTLVLCGGCTRRAEKPSSSNPTEPQSKESRSNRVVVYTYDVFPEPLSVLISEYMEDEYHTAVVFERFADSGGVFNQIYTERDNPKGDVMVGLDTTYLSRLFEDDLFEPYKPDSMLLTGEWLLVDPEYRVVAFDYGGVTLNIDGTTIADPPETLSDLLDPRFESSIILMNPATSSPGRNFLLFTIHELGEAGYLDYWERLKPNILTITGTWYEGYGLYTEGEAPIVLSYETSPAYHREFEDEDRYKSVYLGGRAYAQIEIAGVIRDARNPEEARRIIDYIVSVEFQKEIPFNQFMFPVHPDAPVPESFLSDLPDRVLVHLPSEDVGERIGTWLEAWESKMR